MLLFLASLDKVCSEQIWRNPWTDRVQMRKLVPKSFIPVDDDLDDCWLFCPDTNFLSTSDGDPFETVWMERTYKTEGNHPDADLYLQDERL